MVERQREATITPHRTPPLSAIPT